MIKKILIGLLSVELVLLATGLYRQWINPGKQDVFLGIFTLIFFLVIIPLFLYWRLRDKDLSRYRFRSAPKNDEQ